MRKIVALLFLVFPLTVLAQGNMCHTINGFQMCTNYNTAPLITSLDNTPNAKTMNVWHAMTTAPASITVFTSGLDSAGNVVHYAVASGQVWEYRDYWYPTGSQANTWYHHTEMGSVSNLAAGSGGALYSFQTIPQCTGGSYGIFKWTGSAWTQPSPGACGIHLSVSSADATLAVVGGDHWIYTSSNGGVSYTQISGALAVWKFATIQDATRLIGVTTSTGIWDVALPNGTVTNLAGNTNAAVAIGPSGKTFAIGTDSFSYLFNNTGWDKLLGNGLVSINSCGTTCTFAVNTAGSLFRFPDFALNAFITLNGNTTCTPNCPSATHTPTVTAKFRKSLTGGQTTVGQGVPATQNLEVSAQDSTFDPFDCFDDNFGCLTTNGGASVGYVACSAIGSNIFQAGPSTGGNTGSNWKMAYVRVDTGNDPVLVTHINFQCGTKPVATYDAEFTRWCDQGIDPVPIPDYVFHSWSSCHTIKDGQGVPQIDPNLWAIDAQGKCYYPGPPGTSPLLCLYDILPAGAGFGPWKKYDLIAPGVPLHSRGKCTISGNTQ